MNTNQPQREIRPIRPEELLDCARISSVCFEYSLDTDKDARDFYEQTLADAATSLHKSEVYPLSRYAAFTDGRPTAVVCALPYQVAYDGGRAAMCGIGGVCSHPAYRRGGAIRDIMISILKDEEKKGTEWSILYPFSQTFYAKFGYAQSEPTCQTRFSLHHAVKPPVKGRFELYDGGDYGAFAQAYDAMTGYNMKVIREHCDWAKLVGANPYKSNHFAYVYRNDEGAALGYFIFHKEYDDDPFMDVTELVFDSFDTLSQIIGFAAGFATDYHEIRFTAPLRLWTERLCSDQAGGSFRRQINANGMIRAVNIENALKKSKAKGSGDMVLEIIDPVLGDRRLHIRCKDDAVTDIADTDQAPDAVLPVGDFSSALSGRFDPEDLAALPSIKCSDPRKLAPLFTKKPGYLINYF